MKKTPTINILAIVFCALITCNQALAWETTSEGHTHIETLKDSGRKVLWIQGEAAKDLFKALKSKDGYTVKSDKNDSSMSLLINESNPNDWLCFTISRKLNEIEVSSGVTEYNCRHIPITGA